MSFLKKAAKGAADVIPGLGKLTFDSNLGKVFITSGTGVIGYRVAKSLLEAGHKDVRVGIWKGDRAVGGDKSMGQQVADELEAKGAEVVDFDWSNEDDYPEAVKGVRTVFCTLPHMDHWADVFPAFIKTCKKAKVEHFVKISFVGATDIDNPYHKNVPFVKFHGTCDALVEQATYDSRISYTILCCSHLMSSPLIHMGPSIREEQKFVTASYGMGVNYVSPNDVADAAVVCLLNMGEHRNKTYTLTGLGPIKDCHVAKLISKFYGEPIKHVQLGYHDFKAYVQKLGHPEWLVKDSAELERIKASGIDEKPSSYTKDLEKITGKKPETYAEYFANKESMSPAWKWPTKAGEAPGDTLPDKKEIL